MKLKSSQTIAGFTLSEMLVSLSLSSIVLAAAITSGVSLQKSFSAVITISRLTCSKSVSLII
jgi:prepilin-type N-terminal cleavage/methylation domain-containing protein